MPPHSRWYHTSCFYQDQPLWIHAQLLLFSPHIKFITKPWRLLLLNILSPWPQSGPKPLSLSLGSPLEPNLVCHLQPSMLRSWEAKLLQNKQIEGSTTFCKSLGISPGLWGTGFPWQALQQVLTSSSIASLSPPYVNGATWNSSLLGPINQLCRTSGIQKHHTIGNFIWKVKYESQLLSG